MAAREVDAQIEIERRVRKRYLGSSETKLRDAVFEALRRLYSLPRMPTNPYFFVATALSAHSAHGQRRSVWAVPDEEVLEWMEEVALVDGTEWCKLDRFSDAWGLPHVLRCCDREGLTDLRALLRKFPPALFPKPERVEDYDDPECTRVVCMSLQDGCLHRRAWNGAPARMGLRHDIIVDGPEMARALQTFVDTIVDTVEDVVAASEGHSVKGVLLKPGGQMDTWANEDQRERRNQWWTVEKLRADRTGFDTAVKRATSSHHKVAMECTVRAPVPPVMLDGGYGTAAAAAAQRGGGSMIMHFSVRIYFTFHFRIKAPNKPVSPTAQHYATFPFESLYTGLFLEQAAADAYVSCYGNSVSPSSPMVLKQNAERMIAIGLKSMKDDKMPRALRMAAMLLLLRGDMGWDDGEDGVDVTTDQGLRESTFADLIRMMNTSTVWLHNVSEEVRVLKQLFEGPHALARTQNNAQALYSHLAHLHRRLGDFMRDAVRRDFGLEPLRELMEDGMISAIRGCGRSGISLATPETSRRAGVAAERALSATGLLTLVVSLTRQQEVYMMKPRLALLQAGAFGLNLIKTGEFDAARAAVVDPAAIAAEKRRKAKKREKQNAKIEKENKKKGFFGKKKQLKPTGEDADDQDEGKGGWSLFGRKEEKVETGGLTKLAGIPLVDPRSPMPGPKELDRVWQRIYEVVAPGMCLYWEAGARWIRHNRYVPPKMTHAAILMQYVVDARLDETLQEIFNEAAQPPMVKNPYPAVVQRLRATGHQFDVSFQLVGGDPLTGAGGDTTQLKPGQKARLKGIAGARPIISMVQPPHPVYAARAPEGSTKHAPGARVFGLYSAVRLADPVRLTLLAEALPGLLKSRAWQSGAYQYQCISAFGGDAAFTAGLGPLEDHLGRTKKGKSGGHSNVVGFTPVIEEHTRALGPSLETASDVYGHDVVQRLMAMQEETPWIVHTLTVPKGLVAAAGAVAAKRAVVREQERLARESARARGEPVYGARNFDSDDDSDDVDTPGGTSRPDTAARAERLLARMGSATTRSSSPAAKPPAPAGPDVEKLRELRQRLEEAEEVLKENAKRGSGVGGALGQNAMQESEVIRIPWEELRTNQRDAAKIVSRVAQHGGEACAQISVKFKDRYLPVFVNFHFGWSYRMANTITKGAPLGEARDQDMTTKETQFQMEGWPIDAYTMVFATQADALSYAHWHAHIGDPASPSLMKAAGAEFEVTEVVCAKDMDYLAALRCRVARSLVTSEPFGLSAQLCCAHMGVPMLTQTLQDANSMLQYLVGASEAPEDLLVKLDTRGARTALLEYLDETEKLLTSPSLSYHLGANRIMVKNLATLRKAESESSGILGDEPLEKLREVNTWLAVSETCVTRGLYMITLKRDEVVEIKRKWRRIKRKEKKEKKEKERSQREISREAEERKAREDEKNKIAFRYD